VLSKRSVFSTAIKLPLTAAVDVDNLGRWTVPLCGKGDAALQQKTADLVDQCRATLHQAITNSMHGLHIKLLLRLDRHKAHVLLGHRFGDRFCVEEVVLVRLSVRLYELGRDEPYLVSLFS
jgi:hypothetical protein